VSLRRAWVAALVLAVLVPAGCSDDGPGEGEARLEVDGEAVVERADGTQERVEDDDTDLGPGDRVELVDGVGSLALADGVRFELRSGLDGGDTAPSRVEMAEVPVLEAGDLLVSAPEDTAVEAAGTVIQVSGGSAKVSRDLGAGVAVYDAQVVLDSAGQEVVVPALRQVQVPSLGRAQPERPFRYEPADPWDRRFLGDAIELGDRITELASAYTSTLQPGEGRTPGFFRLVLPGLEDEPVLDELMRKDPDRAPGDRLIGAAITDLGDEGDFADRWESVFGFRDEGAHWGLVALDQAVERTPLMGAITEAANASPLAFAEPGDGGTTPTTTGGAGTDAPADPPPGSSGGSGGPGGGSGSPTTSPPPPPPPPPTTTPPPPETPLDPVLDPVVEPVTEIVGGVIDGLLGLLEP
jgi:hypothetical protein